MNEAYHSEYRNPAPIWAAVVGCAFVIGYTAAMVAESLTGGAASMFSAESVAGRAAAGVSSSPWMYPGYSMPTHEQAMSTVMQPNQFGGFLHPVGSDSGTGAR